MKKHLNFAFFLLWIIVIFLLCSLPSSAFPDTDIRIPHMDKIVHFGLFAILGILFCMWKPEKSLGLSILSATALGFIYGGIIELLQANVFERSGDWYDLAADTAGALCGCLCSYLYLKKFPGRSRRKRV